MPAILPEVIMIKLSSARLLLCVVLASFSFQVAAQECSTEKVNDDCTFTIDRSFPVALPTIQMQPRKRVTVKVVNALPFEILSLDLQTGQAVAGTDQSAGFLSAALPNLKGLLVQQQISAGGPLGFVPPPNPEANLQAALSDINALQTQLDNYFHLMQNFARNSTIVYDQLNEVLGPLPPEVLPEGQRLKTSKVHFDVPRPWVAGEYQAWVVWMTCEIAGQGCSPSFVPPPGAEPCVGTNPPVVGLLVCGSSLINNLAPCPNQPDDHVSCSVAALPQNIDGLSDNDKNALSGPLRRLNETFAALNADAAAVASINKELSIFYVNISQSYLIRSSDTLGGILDPRDTKNQRNVQLKKFLGRQVVFAVNAVNEVGTPATSVTTAAQKKSILTITVLYADPIFEVSTGAIISTLVNRSFANQTTVTQNQQGSSPTLGNVVITQSISKPTVVLFAGANFRMGHDFLWPDKRRGALYLTGTVGLNVNNSAAEFGVGPSLSWRSLVFSVLYDWGHDVRLTQGEYVGMIWCNQSAANASGTIPKCSGSPPSPSTEKYWRGKVAFGISVRIPSIFNGGSSSGH
jgi:hypothetical protein